MKHKIYKMGDSFHFEVLKDYPELMPMCLRDSCGEFLPKVECINETFGFVKVETGDLLTSELLNEWLDKLEIKGFLNAV